MSDTNGSTINAEEVLDRFDSNPVGMVVQLVDGSEVEVSGWRDTPKGRWLRLKRRGGPWVPEVDVAFIRVYTVGLRSSPDLVPA